LVPGNLKKGRELGFSRGFQKRRQGINLIGTWKVGQGKAPKVITRDFLELSYWFNSLG